jgi:hypothetical protein
MVPSLRKRVGCAHWQCMAYCKLPTSLRVVASPSHRCAQQLRTYETPASVGVGGHDSSHICSPAFEHMLHRLTTVTTQSKTCPMQT